MTPHQNQQKLARERKVAAARKEAAKFRDGKGKQRAKASKERSNKV